MRHPVIDSFKIALVVSVPSPKRTSAMPGTPLICMPMMGATPASVNLSLIAMLG